MMNNKGFAITSILYGLLVLFLLTFLAFLAVLSAKRNRLEQMTEGISNIVDISSNYKSYTVGTDFSFPYVTIYRGKYVFLDSSDNVLCTAFLPIGTIITDNTTNLSYSNTNTEVCNTDGDGDYLCGTCTVTTSMISTIKIYSSQNQ